ncbi:MAG: hypothetical protein QM736_19000 [Vicinamibacterales bacterium]
MLDFVRPIRLQVEQTRSRDVLHAADARMADSKGPARDHVDVQFASTRRLPLIDGD